MSNLFANLPLPVLNGPGAAVATDGMGASKTLTVEGDFVGATITIEASVDGGTVYAPVAVFQTGDGEKQVMFSADFMRVNVSGRTALVPFSADCDVGAPAATGLYVAIPMPVSGTGPGVAVDVSAHGALATFIAGGTFPGSVMRVEISEDNIAWAPLLSFSGQGGLQNKTVTAQWVRANVSGRPIFATLALGSAADPLVILGVDVDDDGVAIPNNPHNTLNFIGAGVQATDAGAGVAAVTIPGQNLVFRPGGVAGGNVFTTWASLMTAAALIQGQKTIQFDDSLSSPCIIPGGTYSMLETIWDAFLKPTAQPSRVAVQFGDTATAPNDAIFTNLKQIQGSLAITNRNFATAPVTLPAFGGAFQLGGSGRGMTLTNTGPAPFMDASAIAAGFGNALLLIMQDCVLSGAARAIEFGASPGTLIAFLHGGSIVATGMIAGTNGAASMFVAIAANQAAMGQQNSFAGTKPNFIIPFARMIIGTPTAAPVATLFINSVQAYTAVVAQTLPLIKSLALTVGTSPNGSNGTLDTKGMFLIIKAGAGAVTLTPGAGDTINGSATAVVVPINGSLMLVSDGTSNWLAVGAVDQATLMSPPEMWGQDNVIANQAAVALTTKVSTLFTSIKMMRPGSLAGLSTRFNAALVGAGTPTATVIVTKNGAPTTLQVISTDVSNPTGGQSTLARNVENYVAGDLIGMTITTNAAFLPVTTDMEAWLEVYE